MRENNITVLKVNHRIYPKQTRLRFGIYMFVESMYISDFIIFSRNGQ